MPNPCPECRSTNGSCRQSVIGHPNPACAAGHSRGYLRYLAKNRELTGLRLLTLHNLTYLARLMRDLREAIAAGTLAETAAALRGGAPPSTEPVRAWAAAS